MFGSFNASVMPAYACGKMKSDSPDSSDATPPSSVRGTMTTDDAIGFLVVSQNASFGDRTTWSRLHESIFHSVAENGMLSAISADTSLQSSKASALIRPRNMFLYGAYTSEKP